MLHVYTYCTLFSRRRFNVCPSDVDLKALFKNWLGLILIRLTTFLFHSFSRF